MINWPELHDACQRIADDYDGPGMTGAAETHLPDLFSALGLHSDDEIRAAIREKLGSLLRPDWGKD